MEGVRILAQAPVYETVSSWGWSWAGFALGILAVAILAFIIFLMCNGDITGLLFLIVVGFFGLGSFLLFSEGNSEKVYSHEEYKVIIDDSVSLNDFDEKYEVIGREGEIYTVIEREQG